MYNKYKLSVLMSTYNNCSYVNEAIYSILNQTFADFEFIIVNDGSTDDTINVLQECNDSRITIISHKNNQGRPAARNTALYAASGEYCAWMDSDDVCPFFRLEKQIAFMDAHPDVIVSGGHLQTYETKIIHKKPLTDEAIRIHMVWGSPFSFSSTIIRRIPCLQLGGFHKHFPVSEDYDFWRRLAALPGWRFASLDEVLLRYREHPHADRRIYRAHIAERSSACMKAYLLALGMPETALDMEAHLKLCFQNEPRPVSLKRAQAWVERLMNWNRQSHTFDPHLFDEKCLRQLHSAYVKAPWLPVGLKQLIPPSVKHWVKKNMFALTRRHGGITAE